MNADHQTSTDPFVRRILQLPHSGDRTDTLAFREANSSERPALILTHHDPLSALAAQGFPARSVLRAVFERSSSAANGPNKGANTGANASQLRWPPTDPIAIHRPLTNCNGAEVTAFSPPFLRHRIRYTGNRAMRSYGCHATGADNQKERVLATKSAPKLPEIASVPPRLRCHEAETRAEILGAHDACGGCQ